MEINELQEKLLKVLGEIGNDLFKAISEFLSKECFLLKNNLNERTITHKLAEYIQKYFPDYNVDCEYNRMPNKRDNNAEAEIKFIPKELNLSVSQIYSDDDKGTTVYPDIIIHKRGSNDSNLIVIEVKKANSNNNFKAFDCEKLKAFTDTTKLKYKYGIYLELNKNCPWIEIIKFFRNGAKYNELL